MAGSLAAGQGGGRRRGRRRRGAPIAEINMTPFIDVVLVLLIVFMVAAPLLTAGVPIDLPKTGASALNVDRKPVTVSIDERGGLFLGEEPIAEADLTAKLKLAAHDDLEERVYVRGHRSVDYGKVARVMSLVTAAGFRRVALLTEQERKG